MAVQACESGSLSLLHVDLLHKVSSVSVCERVAERLLNVVYLPLHLNQLLFECLNGRLERQLKRLLSPSSGILDSLQSRVVLVALTSYHRNACIQLTHLASCEVELSLY